MASTPKKSTEAAITLPHDQVMRVLNREFTHFFSGMLTPEPGWPRPSDQQFIEAVGRSLVEVGNQVREGRGLAMLQTFVYDLQDLINSDVLGEPSAVKPVAAKFPSLPKRASAAADQNSDQAVHAWDQYDDRGLNPDSPLYRMGYNVAESGPTNAERREILETAMSEPTLPGVKTQEDKKRWGKPNSAQRLYAISRFLAWLCNFQGVEKPAARKKWLADLEFLRREYYSEDMPFRWPETDSETKNTPVKKRTPNAAFMKPLKLSPALSAVVGTAALPRTEIVRKLWVYIKAKGLQDKRNKRMVNADEKLRAVFGKTQVSMFEMAGLIGKHVK